MKMTFLFKVEGFEITNNTRSEYSNGSTSYTLGNFEYSVGMESKPGEMSEIYEGIAKMLPQIIEGVKSAMQFQTSTTPNQTSEANPTQAQTEDQQEPVGEMDNDNLDPNRFKEV